MKLTIECAIKQRDRADSRARGLALHNAGLQERIDRLEPIAQAAGRVLERWEELGNASSPALLDHALAELRKAVRR